MEEKITYKKYCPNVFVAQCEKKHEKGEIIYVQTSRGNLHECEVWNYIGMSRDGLHMYSITRTDGTNKATMAARRAERRQEWADKAEARSTQYCERAESAVEGIPFGQPILVGHHSEGRHRAAIRRSQSAMDRCVEESDKAEAHRSKAAYWERKAEDVTLDMPESLEYFRAELEKAEEYHEGLKSGKYPRQHSYSLTYAKNHVNDLRKKIAIAEKLWQ